ncbi:hypothetical protein ACFL5K_00480 [Gemmatimonadota bacterium]
MWEITRQYVLKGVLAVMVLVMAQAERSIAQERVVSASVALEEALAKLGLEPEEVSAGLAEIDSAALEKRLAPGLRVSRNGLGTSIDRLKKTILRLGNMSEAEDFLFFKFLEREAGKKVITPRAGQDSVSPIFRKDGAEFDTSGLRDSLESLIPGSGDAFDCFLAGDSLIRRAFIYLSPAEREELADLIRGFRAEDDQWPDFPLERMLSLARRVDTETLELSGETMARAVETFRLALENWSYQESRIESGGPLLSLDTPFGVVLVGGPGADTYEGSFWLLIEPGGDDTYRPGSVEWGTSLIIDLAGDDNYQATDSFSLGAALCGMSWLEDLSGDDTYEAGFFSLGSTAMGVGVLVDRDGNDRYRGASFCQGAALFGLGLLLDCAGNDSYETAFCGQGAVVGPGRAVLADLGGSDSYHAGGLVREWREPGATKSWAQGAALGIRPFAPGGQALLYDRDGNDSYKVDYFGQGAGYWEALGLLVDCRGDDIYRGGRYAQGCGLHRAAGMLADCQGHDSYEVSSVGQGMGEDRALGVLIEYTGSDTYQAEWMARGVGGTGGVGLLIELSGKDSYSQTRKAADGFGSRWRELSGLGFMIDCAGDDVYGGLQRNGGIRRSGTWGAALDLPLDKEVR